MAIEAERQFQAGVPRTLFKTVSNLTTRQYVASNDGRRLLMVVPRSDQDASPLLITVVVNWLAAMPK